MNITMDIRGLADVQSMLRGLTGPDKDKAIQMAINKTADKGRAELNRAITQQYAIRATEVRNSVTMRRAHKNQSVTTATINIFGSPSKRGRSMNMIHFMQVLSSGLKRNGKRASKKNINALAGQLGFVVKKGGGIKKIEGAFLGNKGRTVFHRLGKDRLPIEPMQVIGVSQMFNSRAIRGRVMAKMSDDFEVELNRAIKALIDRKFSNAVNSVFKALL